MAWYASNSAISQPVGTKTPNELGLFDMSGNVWEWNHDWYGSYPSSAETDPVGPTSGSNRVHRSGRYGIDASYCTVANRDSAPPSYASDGVGFRVVRRDSASTPAAPSGLTATTSSSSSIQLAWTDNSSNETAFKIERSPDGSTDWTQIGFTLADVATYDDTGLSFETTYYYRVRAYDKGLDSAYTSTANAKTTMEPEMITVVGGSFEMGSASGNADELPVHTVIISSFKMSKYEITQAKYLRIMGYNPASGYGVGEYYPVYYLTWQDAAEFCNFLSDSEGFDRVYSISGRTPPTEYPITSATVTADFSKNGYRLPTEAEWEYAARGGAASQGYTYAGSNSIDAVAWYSGNSTNSNHAVGGKAPNELGLYDMSGNSWEYCWDWSSSSYLAEVQFDPLGSDVVFSHIIRGGGFNYTAVNCRPTARNGCLPIYSNNPDGSFRVVRRDSASTPAAPSGLSASSLTSSSIHLAWTDNSSNETAFKIERSPDGSTGWTQIGFTLADVATYDDTGLSFETTYYYRVRAYDKGLDSSYTSTVNAKPTMSPEMISVTGGVFTQGRQVLLSDYRMSRYEITFNQYDAFCNATSRTLPGDNSWGRGLRPVIYISYYDAIEFCNWLSTQESLDAAYSGSGESWTLDVTKNGYRLPTDAEWEFAARGGIATNGFTYAGSNNADDVAWYVANSDSQTHPVGLKLANEIGLYDMSGNVLERYHDWYAAYPSEPEVDPLGPTSGTYRMYGSGCWGSSLAGTEIAAKSWGSPSLKDYMLGFRVVRRDSVAAPSAPSGLSASTLSSSSIHLTWTDNSSNETGFKIERSPNGSSGWTQICAVVSGTTTYDDAGLSSGTTYYYRVRAANGGGDSGYSSSADTMTDYAIGSVGPAGGIVFYDKGSYSDGWRWLEAATSDQSTGIYWNNGSDITTGATATVTGSGESNTATIVSAQGAGSYAASICADLALGGFDDWFLPSKDEFILMREQYAVIGGFLDGSYWSSSEYNTYGAWSLYFNNPNLDGNGSKSTNRRVRAVRAF